MLAAVAMVASLKLLPSSRFCAPHHQAQNGKIVWISTTGKLCCEHGEYINQVRDWIREEGKAAAEGKPVATRKNTICDCSDVSEYGRFPRKAATPPAAPNSVYDFLEASGEEHEVVIGETIYKIPHMDGPTFLREDGTMVCKHGHPRKSVFLQSRAPAKCACKFGPMVPRKDRFSGVKLGRVAKWRTRTIPLFELHAIQETNPPAPARTECPPCM